MQVKSTAECFRGAICSILENLKKIVLSIFEWLLKTGFIYKPVHKTVVSSSHVLSPVQLIEKGVLLS